MDLKLNNKNALVCGSTQGIGKATAIALAAEGVNVTLVARNREKLKAVLAELPNHRNHSYIVADFSNPRELQEQVIKFIEKGNPSFFDEKDKSENQEDTNPALGDESSVQEDVETIQ